MRMSLLSPPEGGLQSGNHSGKHSDLPTAIGLKSDRGGLKSALQTTNGASHV